MTTLAEGKLRKSALGDISAYPMIALDIVHAGAAVGLVDATGHARPLTSVDRFGGFASKKADNSTGAAADINVEVDIRGVKVLDVSGAVITDISAPIYATDDDVFVFSPVGAVFIGTVTRFVSAGVVEVQYDALNQTDPYSVYGAPGEYETISANKTLDIEDNGKVFFVDTDAKVITLPVVATPVNCTIVNIGAFATILVAISPNANDMIHAPDIGGTDNKDHLNTKATSRRGDLCQLRTGDAVGWPVSNQIGIWAQET